VMRVAKRFAGYSLAQADSLRKAMGKKSREVMAKEKAAFLEGCASTGYDEKLGAELFGIIEQFADYAFNKSHSYGYGLIAYQTAYLKAHHPVEYFAALLTSVKANLDKAAVYLAECRAMGVKVLTPDVNRSASDFVAAHVEGADVIPFGLSAVRNVGSGLVELILAEREARGPFRDFYDFCDRVDLQVLNKRTIESLIKAGAFDAVGHPRKGLLAVFEGVIDKTVARRREFDMGVMTLFGDAAEAGGMSFDDRSEIPDVEFDKRDRLAFEKEMLGLYVSDHPLMGAEGALRRKTDGTLADAAEVEEGSIKSYGGVITSLNRKWTRAGDLMAVFALEDLSSQMEVMVFPKTMSVIGHKLADDAVVIVKGRLDKRDDQPKLIAMDVEVFEGITDGAPPVRIEVPAAISDQLAGRLHALISEHPGDSVVFLHTGRQVVKLPDRFNVDAASGFLGEVRVLLGADCLL
jgi:DNA polymerase III subunit alpha